ncbi:hypothetical protein Tco_1360206 [Tanacetum coccineum]
MKNLNFFYQDIGTSSSAGVHVNLQEESKQKNIGIQNQPKFTLFKGKLWEHTMMRPDHQDSNALDNMKPWKRYCSHKFIISSCYGNDATDMQSRVARRFGLYHGMLMKLEKDGIMRDTLEGRYDANMVLVITRWMKRKGAGNLIDSEGRLIPKDPQPGVPRVGIPRPPRASMQDLYDRMGRMEIRQEAIERIEYRQETTTHMVRPVHSKISITAIHTTTTATAAKDDE